MTRWTPCKRRIFIQRLRRLGFEGPFSGTRHQFMVYQYHRLVIPSNAELSVTQIRMLLHEIDAILGEEITLERWMSIE